MCIFTNNKSARDGLGFLTHVWVAQLGRKRGKIVPNLACQASSLSYNPSFEMWDGSELDYWAHIPSDAYLQDMARIVKIAKGDYRVATEKEEQRRQRLWNLFQQMESHTRQHGLEFPFSKTK